MKPTLLVFALLITLISSSWSMKQEEYESFDEWKSLTEEELLLEELQLDDTTTEFLKDAPITNPDEDNIGLFEGYAIDSKVDMDERYIRKEVKISFIFSKQSLYGTSMVDYFDSLDRSIVIDFYDNELGESEITPYLEKEFPVKDIEVNQFSSDLNKNVSGFEKDIRNVVKVKINIGKNIPYIIDIDEYSIPYIKVVIQKDLLPPNENLKGVLVTLTFIVSSGLLILISMVYKD